MQKNLSNKELVAAGHQFAKSLSSDTPLIDMAKMVSQLATQLDVALVAAGEACKQRDAVLAENVMLKSGIGFFSYGPDSGFEEHDSAEKAIEVADIDIGCYREDARDGWAEEVDQVTWGIIMQRATMTGLRPVNEDDNCAEWAEEWCDYTLLPNLETPATDAMLNAVRAEGIYFAANRMLAAWDSGFIDDTPAQAYDISGAVLSAVEVLPDASHGDFKRDFADSIRAEIAAKSRATTDTTPSQYESLAGDQ